MPRLLMYTSDACALMEQDPQQMAAGLADIERTAKQRNAELDVCGVLIVDQGHFVQILEGSTRAIDALMNSILADNRHKNVNILMDEPIAAKSFKDWNMDVFLLDDHPDLPGEEIGHFRDAYLANEKPNGVELGRWIKRLIAHPDIRFRGNQ
ncbi:BLUF domain-containing protein [Simiduia agarivorans]|uniref:BLUF domain-containing protein n=1 Tax=Simiduia agarivorans (strain DSM 21679 / JCM 13881 / BCRC 17597 / SA1) TaxID=1117647 RepID=K4KJW5_SIMAS|nr:BLUF domain-containing protein [Simiduia agarivorans]AFU98308.1 hypothetical protein M5M_05515 [Simiduia agarivorans SA1 = DSM 21679]